MRKDLKPTSLDALEAELNSKSPLFTNADDEDARFQKSLLELKDLRSQLHYAADYCENSYLKSKEKKMVMENTKEYVCRALVTVVDHLGNVSMGIESQILSKNQFDETENQMTCLQQRVLTCQEYVQRLNLSKLCWNTNLQRHHTRYISLQTLNLDKSIDLLRGDDDSLVPKTMPRVCLSTAKEMPISQYKHAHKASLTKLPVADMSCVKKLNPNSPPGSKFPIVLPVHEPFLMSVPRNPVFHFQEAKKHGRNEHNRRLLQLPWRKSYRIH